MTGLEQILVSPYEVQNEAARAAQHKASNMPPSFVVSPIMVRATISSPTSARFQEFTLDTLPGKKELFSTSIWLWGQTLKPAVVTDDW